MTTPTSERAALTFLQFFYHALRAVKMRGPGTAEARAATEDFHGSLEPFFDEESTLRIRVVRKTLYVNDEAVANDIDNFVYYGYVVDTIRGAGIGIIEFESKPGLKHLQVFLTLLARVSGPEADPTKPVKLRRAMESQAVEGITASPPPTGGADLPGGAESREAARKTYEESVAVSKELFNGTRMGRAANVKHVRHAVQNIVDGVLNDEASLGGLSTLKDYDDYAFTHAVNVCIFCVAIGRRLGLSKAKLYDLGHAALVHDLGMSRIPKKILTKGSKLTAVERRMMEAHTWLGALTIFELRDFGEIPFQSMVVAYEHHMLSGDHGYPVPVRPREPSVFSKIIAVAAAFDAATNERSYSKALPADEVLRELWENKELGFDPVIVKALINLLGIYPVGTCVILDTYELALVHAANADPTFVHRPTVRLLCDADGLWLEPAPLVDLSKTDDEGGFERSIIKVTDPDRYGIKVSDYFV